MSIIVLSFFFRLVIYYPRITSVDVTTNKKIQIKVTLGYLLFYCYFFFLRTQGMFVRKMCIQKVQQNLLVPKQNKTVS
jgi:hypothetical protein